MNGPRISTLQDKIQDMETAVEAGAYLSAFAMALTIPDICARIDYPGEKDCIRYPRWMDEHYVRYERPQYSANGALDNLNDKQDGEFYYQVRCAYLHCGNLDVRKNLLEGLEVVLNTHDYELDSVSTCQCEVNGEYKDKPVSHRVMISVPSFCRKMAAIVKNSYLPMMDDPDKRRLLEDHSFSIWE